MNKSINCDEIIEFFNNWILVREESIHSSKKLIHNETIKPHDLRFVELSKDIHVDKFMVDLFIEKDIEETFKECVDEGVDFISYIKKWFQGELNFAIMEAPTSPVDIMIRHYKIVEMQKFWNEFDSFLDNLKNNDEN